MANELDGFSKDTISFCGRRSCRFRSSSRTWCAGRRTSCYFAREHGGYTFEQTLDLFLAEVGKTLSPNNVAGLLYMANWVLVSVARLRNPDWG